ALTHYEVAQQPFAGAAVVWLQLLRPAPVDHPLAHVVASLRREQTVLDRHDLIPATGCMKAAQQSSVGVRPERILELVAVAPQLDCGHDRLKLEAIEAADSPQRVIDLGLLYLELSLVRQFLPGGTGM